MLFFRKDWLLFALKASHPSGEYINKDNEEVLPFKYDIAEPFYNNIARVGLYGKKHENQQAGQ